ncbi:transketolase [Desulfobacula sp.]|uniref:transketolase n=1 Tax=Desulfobacula sp. TaxID=2593537 RepID=UPI0025B81D4C|nr:transketolase [Desulfobacula sp.]MBC2705553.1 transketolase [Desulfobacula sp.]
MAQAKTNLDQLTVSTVRTLCMDAVQKANSGHPGAPMGLAPAAYVLFKRFLKHNPKNPAWIDRDRFVMSGGHVSSLLYSLLYLMGYGLELNDLKNFRQWGSRTPGHPERGDTPGVETTTGPLGQGIANAVGMAIAERHLAARFNMKEKELINHHTYVMCGDGDLMEGVALETISLAGHLGLGKLICLYDDNSITIEGKTDISFTEDVKAKFESQNWHVVTVEDGNDLAEIQKAIQAGKDAVARPTLVQIKTHIAYGSPNKQDSSDAHGAPLGVDEIKLVKQFYGVPDDKDFYVPEEVLENCRKALIYGEGFEQSWQDLFNDYKTEYPEHADKFVDAISGFLTEGWDADIPQFDPEDGPIATRAASGQVLNAIADSLPALMGGSADLAPSNKTYLNNSTDFQKDAWEGRNIRFGVREHAMGAIMSGMYLHSGIRPYGGTFMVFADYMRPAIRMASLMKLPLIYVFTHDSVAVGEDGPTHQPVEHLASLRAIPGLTVVRPADANETALAWKQALKTIDSPTALILSRQKLPTLDVSQRDGEFNYGAYTVKKVIDPDMILIATGSEVHICVEAADTLEKDHNIKAAVVSMPSWELFEKAPASYRERILPSGVTKRMAVEAGISMGWEKYTGQEGKTIGIDKFGASAPGGTVLKEYGFSPENIVNNALDLLK